MAQRTQLCALYHCFCHPSQGKHDDDGEGTSWSETRVSLHRCVVGVGVRTRGGMVGPRHRVVVRGGRWHIILIVSLSCCCRVGGRGCIDIVVRERVMVMARVCHQCHRHRREGVGEGQHIIIGERERVSTLLLLLLERGRGCIIVRERVSLSERRQG